MAINVAKNSLDWALTHAEHYGDTDVFPKPFEFKAIKFKWNTLRASLVKQDLDTRPVRAIRRGIAWSTPRNDRARWAICGCGARVRTMSMLYLPMYIPRAPSPISKKIRRSPFSGSMPPPTKAAVSGAKVKSSPPANFTIKPRLCWLPGT
jgi:hypothetical protein